MKRCKQCGKKFDSEAGLRMHAQRVHGKMGPQTGQPWPQRPKGWKQREIEQAVNLAAAVAQAVEVEKIPMPEATTLGALVPQRQTEVKQPPVIPQRLPYNGDYTCPICAAHYTNSNSYRSHVRTKHQDFYRETLLANKRARAKNQAEYVGCPECQKTYKRSTINTHLRLIHGVYQLGPRNPKNADKVQKLMPRSFYLNGSHKETVDTILSSAVPEAPTEPNADKFLAMRIQALIQLGELIAHLKG